MSLILIRQKTQPKRVRVEWMGFVCRTHLNIKKF